MPLGEQISFADGIIHSLAARELFLPRLFMHSVLALAWAEFSQFQFISAAEVLLGTIISLTAAGTLQPDVIAFLFRHC